MTFLVRLPIDLYPADALDGLAAHEGFDLGTARAAAWAAQLAYEDEADKRAAIARRWGVDLVAFDPPTRAALPMPHTRGVVLRRGGTTLLAFSGTDPLVLADWLTDFMVMLDDDGLHRGFVGALAAAWTDIAATLAGHAATDRLLITGHSLGGALAVLAAQRAVIEHMLVPEVYTFGMPRVGNEAFARDYDAVLGRRTFRLVHGEDLVPTVPPSVLGFHHVGCCLACARHTRFDARLLKPPPCDDPLFVPGLQSALREGVRRMLSLSLDPLIRSDLKGQASRLLPPALGDHLPDRYWQALAPEPEPTPQAAPAAG
ncbi:lipase family protein [Rhodoplanes sp. TEM]|uniref:Lipase family protein n=1 Tax=Rhodoplanes tepidamans TaxID=200616 RepID=A0ABT5JEV1_RHOTP|nr:MULTISPECIES: lipase family protein [Rhodoplanes]MDC7788129.1 lipase family protein [Rhodoplanes tepidamans]MDC7984572.1 lipase family protein [Rhodoplanes sp. TEM]MDQ0355181.1 hypothetical protein [Rhodoplanes tepidamans]